MDFITAYKKVRSRLPEVTTEPLQRYFPKSGIQERGNLKEGFEKLYERFRDVKDTIENNKEIIIPLGVSLGSFFITCRTGYPFYHFDKVMHYFWGYGTSRLGIKIARKFNKEEYESLASLAMSLGSGVTIELWESNPLTLSISNALSGVAYKKEFGLQTIDPLDLGANLAGYITENIREYATKAKEGILKGFRKSKL